MAAVIGGTLSVLDSTLVVPLLVSIGKEFDGGTEVSWLVAAYLLATTVTMPLWGRWLDTAGERRPMWTALLVFAAGTMLAVVSPSLEVLIVARVIQGIGAGGLVPLGQAVLASRCTGEERARLQVFYSVAYGAAAGVGPLIGGALAGSSWRWAFVIILPVTMLMALLMRGQLNSQPTTDQPEPFDYLGATLLATFLLLILLGIERQWVAGLLLALLPLVGLLYRSSRIPHAVIPWRVLSKSQVLGAAAVMGLIGFVQFSLITYLPMLSARVAPELNSGIVVIPLTVLWMTSGAVSGVLALRVGYRFMAIFGVLCGAAAGGVLAFSVELPALFLASTLAGLAAGAVLVPLMLSVQKQVAKADVGSATSFAVLARNFGGAAGAAVTAVLLARTGTSEAFTIVAVITLVALLPSLVLPGSHRNRVLNSP